MATTVNLNGFKNYPKGNSNIRLDNGTLVLSDSLNSTDGLIVETNKAKGFEMSFKPHTITRAEVFGSTFNIQDGLGRIKTIGQWALTPNSDGKYAYLMVNSRLEGDTIQVTGMKNGRVVYSKSITNLKEENDPYCNFLVLLAFAIVGSVTVVAVSSCKKEKKTKQNAQGKTIEVEEVITKSIGLNCKMLPIINTAATTNPTLDEDNPIEIDEIIISSSRFYPDEIPTELDGEITEVIFNTNTRENIVITEEKALTE